MILVYITCKDKSEAKKIGESLMAKRLCACINILPNTKALAFWPPKSGKIEISNEAILLVKTIEKKYNEIEKEVLRIHSYELPCIFSLKVDCVYGKYKKWLKGEIDK